jgi:hypothetical protein
MLWENPKVKAGQFLLGEGIYVATQGINELGDFASRVTASALEKHVLQKMRQARFVIPFVLRPDIQPNADGNGLRPRETLTDEADAVGQGGGEGRRHLLSTPSNSV